MEHFFWVGDSCGNYSHGNPYGGVDFDIRVSQTEWRKEIFAEFSAAQINCESFDLYLNFVEKYSLLNLSIWFETENSLENSQFPVIEIFPRDRVVTEKKKSKIFENIPSNFLSQFFETGDFLPLGCTFSNDTIFQKWKFVGKLKSIQIYLCEELCVGFPYFILKLEGVLFFNCHCGESLDAELYSLSECNLNDTNIALEKPSALIIKKEIFYTKSQFRPYGKIHQVFWNLQGSKSSSSQIINFREIFHNFVKIKKISFFVETSLVKMYNFFSNFSNFF